MEFIGYILITIIAVAISPVIKGLVNKFVTEDELEEEALQYKENSNKKDKNKENSKANNRTKVKFVPEFDWKVAVITVVAELSLFIRFGITWDFGIYAFLMILLIICMFADIKGCIIPNEVNFIGFIVGIMLAFIKLNIDISQGIDAIAGMLVGFLTFLAIAGLSILLFKREGMGGGDIKLMGVIGLYVGFFNNIQVFILSFFIAAIISTILLVTKRKKSDDYIPFGPFIVLATYITILFPASVTMPALLQLI